MPTTRKKDSEKDPGSPAHIMKSLLVLIEDLAELMIAEIGLIETRKMPEHAELLKRKQRLTIDYRASIKSLALRPDIFRQIPDELRQAAKAAAQKLADACERNGRALRAAILAAQRLTQTIVGIVRDEMLPKGGYVNPQTAHMALGTYSPTCKPVTFRQTA
jgi:hypothetical protein